MRCTRDRSAGPESLDTMQLFSANRTPEHVALVFNEADLVLLDCVNAAVFVLALGISTVSLFDPRGLLRSRSAQIADLITHRCRRLGLRRDIRFRELFAPDNTKHVLNGEGSQTIVSLYTNSF